MKLLMIAVALLSTPAAAGTYDTLLKIHRDVQHDIKPIDMQTRGLDHVGQAEPPSGIGDCRDYALTKIARLEKLGIHGKIVRGFIPGVGFHAIAVVGDMALDNRYPMRPMRLSELRRAGYLLPESP